MINCRRSSQNIIYTMLTRVDEMNTSTLEQIIWLMWWLLCVNFSISYLLFFENSNDTRQQSLQYFIDYNVYFMFASTKSCLNIERKTTSL